MLNPTPPPKKKFTHNGIVVCSNVFFLAVEDMDVSAFMELLYQSNNTLLPVLLWDESLLSVL